MQRKDDLTQKTLQDLLSGSHPLSKKYGGKHVFVIDRNVVVMGRGKKAISEFKQLKEKYGRSPVVTFIPQPGTSYILIIQ